MAVKCEMLFQSGDQDGGWSEVYWLNGTAIPSALLAMDQLAAVRVRILSGDNTIIGYRITAPLAPPGPGFIRAQRTAYLATRNIAGSPTGGSAATSDLVWSAVMLRLNDSSLTVFKNQMYRGIPDIFWENGTEATARAFMTSFIPAWQAALIAAGAVIQHRTRPATNTYVPIQSVEFIRMTRRATGRAFGLLRGRR